MATTATAAPKSGDLPPRAGWKNRFMKRGSKGGAQDGPKEADNGLTRSLSAKRNQKKKGSGLIRKLGFNSFRKERPEALNTEFPSVMNDASDSSPGSNPQSPFSTDSYVSIEVREEIALLA